MCFLNLRITSRGMTIPFYEVKNSTRRSGSINNISSSETMTSYRYPMDIDWQDMDSLGMFLIRSADIPHMIILAALSVKCRHPLHVHEGYHGDMLCTFYEHMPGPLAVFPIMLITVAATAVGQFQQAECHTSRTVTLCAHVFRVCMLTQCSILNILGPPQSASGLMN